MMNKKEKSAIALYMPVYHKGYRKYFDANKDVDVCYVFSNEILKSLDYIRKDIRAISPDEQVDLIKGLGLFNKVQEISWSNLRAVDKEDTNLIMPNEDISVEVSKKLKNASVCYYPIFLRWHRDNVNTVINKKNDVSVSFSEINKKFMKDAYKESQKSSDIWRHVGAAIAIKGKEMGVGFNSPAPSIHSSFMEGDPRNIFKRGVGIEMSTFLHAEASIIARAAKEGVSLEGADIYVTTFPCPACAKLIANSGIKRCYFSEGYAVLDGARVLEENNIEIIKIEGVEENTDSRRLEDYKKTNS